MSGRSRREFLRSAAGAAAAAAAPGIARAAAAASAAGPAPADAIRFGLVTYLWGADLALPELIEACVAGGLLGVELRTTHAHGVEPALDRRRRLEIRDRLRDSALEWWAIGSDERFDHPEPARLATAIGATMDFLKLSADVGGTGVKVKPDSFHEGVPRERTIEQIGQALNAVGRHAAELGQRLRLELHGGCAEPATIAAILAVADHPAVAACWNCNDEDLRGAGLAAHFALLRPRFGDTLHVRAFDRHDYPYPELARLLRASRWRGWLLLEARGELPADRPAAFARQREHYRMLLGSDLD